MKRIVLPLAAFCIVVLPSIARADWLTNVEDDIFSGGKKATMLGYISAGSFFTADCVTDGSVSLAYAEKGKWVDGLDLLKFRLLVKVDAGAVREFVGKASQRNDETWQVEATDQDDVLATIKAIGNTKKQVLIGLQEPVTGMKYSGTVTARGSTRAVKQFVEACGI
ncbi:hypothetical protein OSH11_12760 [Kaistia dalseonensis]|uniref:Uncharacterized protein n=1 Tax=Kaistia dalseonensis TaxID=410840 RepID=A0ABU0H789_9HYPH|nr:hypothetical protein [Kaistia dalseonensis]MCX5495581.1 hypothetical protein [Kaistia dalseonensis]MDQ0438173.1 hypothetical protein [Kaistia dalseonensis]